MNRIVYRFTVFAPVIAGTASLHQDQGPTGSISSSCSDFRNAEGQLQLYFVIVQSRAQASYTQGGDPLRRDILELRPIAIRTAAEGDVQLVQNNRLHFWVTQLR